MTDLDLNAIQEETTARAQDAERNAAGALADPEAWKRHVGDCRYFQAVDALLVRVAELEQENERLRGEIFRHGTLATEVEAADRERDVARAEAAHFRQALEHIISCPENEAAEAADAALYAFPVSGVRPVERDDARALAERYREALEEIRSKPSDTIAGRNRIIDAALGALTVTSSTATCSPGRNKHETGWSGRSAALAYVTSSGRR